MSYFNKLIVLAIFGLVLAGLSMTAEAQCTPLVSGAPAVPAVGLPVIPMGNVGNGITDSVTWTTGVGNALNTNSFNNLAGPFGGCGFAPFGLGAFQNGFGANVGTQNSAEVGYSESRSFGLQPQGIVFGVPVSGPGGLLYT